MSRAPLALGLVAALLATGIGCGGSSAPPVPPAEARTPVPTVQPVRPPDATSPYARALPPSLDAVRERLRGFVRTHGLAEPGNAWVLGHALLALGPDATLADGTPVVDHLFRTWAVASPVPGGPLLDFPGSLDGVPVQPHDGLFLKVFADLGVDPARPVIAAGEPATVGDLYRSTLYRTWVSDDALWASTPNDTPWVLQALASQAPAGLAWTALDGRAMTLDALTHRVVDELVRQSAELHRWQARGEPYRKRGQGIFGFTCGGAHLLQGAGEAVGRGFGAPGDREAVAGEAQLQLWRLEQELGVVDAALEQAPQFALLLTVQRLKFLGHHLETVHRLAAVGLVPAGDATVLANLERAEAELERTVGMLDRLGALQDPAAVRAAREQTWLDLIGDSAHAVRGLDLAAGAAGVPAQVAAPPAER
ncbi:MAG: hypothetical protein H6732_15935 [Alphaproteobacteria bacterium]|nr:hypothetical protein [Alphaproteobacteria bacterium]